MYYAIVHKWYQDAAVNTSGFHWEAGNFYYKVVESNVPGWEDSDARYLDEKLSRISSILDRQVKCIVEIKVIDTTG